MELWRQPVVDVGTFLRTSVTLLAEITRRVPQDFHKRVMLNQLSLLAAMSSAPATACV